MASLTGSQSSLVNRAQHSFEEVATSFKSTNAEAEKQIQPGATIVPISQNDPLAQDKPEQRGQISSSRLERETSVKNGEINQSHQKWDVFKDLIKRLYIDENKPLRDIMAIMAHEYGFLATQRQYKARISMWKYNKNFKSTEMLYIARKKHERQKIGKETAFRVRGRVVTMAEVERYLKRSHAIIDLDAKEATPEDIEYYTPEESGEEGPGPAPAMGLLNHSVSPTTSTAGQLSPPHALLSPRLSTPNACDIRSTKSNFQFGMPATENSSTRSIPHKEKLVKPVETYPHPSTYSNYSGFPLNPTLGTDSRVAAPRSLHTASATTPNTIHAPQTRQNLDTVPSTGGEIASLGLQTFIKVQEILKVALEDGMPLSDGKKESLANFLGISSAQMHHCIKANQALEPILNNLKLKSQELGIPTEYITSWFDLKISGSRRVEQQAITDSGYGTAKAPEDSAYDSTDLKHWDMGASTRKRKKRYESLVPRNFQCTHISNDGVFCLQESSNFTDWKRHEETHYPQRRWECLIDGPSPQTSCHVCGELIDAGDTYTSNHTACLGKQPRRGHDFPRRDKLLVHVRSDHGVEANIESWQYLIRSNWRRFCGFCGQSFSDWDARCEHVAKHFAEGKTMIPDWKDPWPGGVDDDGGEDDAPLEPM